jgi:hypothetical protein
MLCRRAGLVIAPVLLAAAACSPQGEEATAEAEGGASPTAEEAAIPAAADPPSDPLPAKLLGLWVYSHEECEPGSEFSPNKARIDAEISFEPDGTYYMGVEGFPFTGTYRYEGGQSPRIQLDGNLLNFAVEGDTLQNWSEGDAVYQCGRVFVRKQ